MRKVCIGFLLTVAANAAIVTFSGTDPGANSTDPRPNSNAAAALFDAAVIGLGTKTVFTFETSPLGSFSNLSLGGGVSINGTDAIGGNQTIVNSAVGSPDRLFGYNTTAAGSRWVSLFGGNLVFTFTTPINSFGVYLTGVQLDGEVITFNDGSPQSINIPNPGGTGGALFIGFTDAGKSISSLTINVQVGGTGDIVGVDDVRVVTAAAVPEPATLLLCGAALAALGLIRRRRTAA